jgi:bacillithiol biosynthesis cysteine-adding enzyme BshC
MIISKSFSSIDSINGFSGLFKAYIAGAEELKPLYGLPPSQEGFRQMIASSPFPATNRSLVAEVITDQYLQGGITPSARVLDNLTALRNENCYTVCTGHQLCLFTGPLYFIYKIISTINLAEALREKHPGSNFIPVYWLASEDHDFEEVNHVQLFGKKLVWEKGEAMGAVETMPAGKISTRSLQPMLEELKRILGDSANATLLNRLLSESYQKGRTLADATRYFTHLLLGEFGLLILDPSDIRLKKLFIPVMSRELEKQENAGKVKEGIAALAELGYEAQVNPRDINLFYMKDDLRARIERTADGEGYHVLNTSLSFTQERLMEELRAHPERFSPNVVLRPLYQQLILPNIAYVGGPGELAYWLEYKTMFELNGIVFPILVPRNFVMWVDGATSAKMDKFGLTVGSLSRNLSEIEKEYMETVRNPESKLDEEVNQLTTLYASILVKAATVDATLKAPAEAELQKALNGVRNLEAKMGKAEKQKQETSLNQLKVLKEKLYPGGSLQERVDNFLPFYLKHGETFLKTLKESLDPFERNLIVFTEKD